MGVIAYLYTTADAGLANLCSKKKRLHVWIDQIILNKDINQGL